MRTPRCWRIAARPAAGQGRTHPKGQIDKTARKEIEDLRKRVEALEGRQQAPDAERQKVVVSNPLAKDVDVAQQYVARMRAHHHINVSAMAGGYLEEITVKEGQAVKKGDVLFKVLPILSQAKLDAEMAEVRIAQTGVRATPRSCSGKKP